MASALRITSLNLSGEIVFVTLLQNNITYIIGEKVIPFDVYPRPETSKLSGLYTLYVPNYLTSYDLIIPEVVDPTPTPTVTPTNTITPTITPTQTITPTNTITPTQT
jgi:hypothetical protein